MITFDVEFKVLEKENKSVPRRDGNGTFDFTEVKIETTDKKPTTLLARLADKEMEVKVGRTYNMKIGVSSTATSTGKIFTNFVVLAFQITGIQDDDPVIPFEMDDEIPF